MGGAWCEDYAAYAAANSGVDTEWRAEAKEPTLPVVNVSWEDAKAFCAWLSQKEGKTYRLPTDHEWSLAVGIGDREDPNASPKEKAGKVPDVYPWGSQWPPPARAGNYGTIEGYSDDHSGLAPVGSYAPNGLGIFDLGGNVWEWCEDFYDGNSGSRVLRGAAWDDVDPIVLLSSYRSYFTAVYRSDYLGFRLVLEGGGER